MKELEELRNGLTNSSLMLIKDCDSYLECSFVKGGLVKQLVKVEDEILIEALRCKMKAGIAEGIQFNTFRHEFDSFALHVKARRLYAKLLYSLPMYMEPVLKEEVYSQSVDVAVA